MDVKIPDEVIQEMQDVPRQYPYKTRRNWKHHGRTLQALEEKSITNHVCPMDFWRRNWKDQKAYFECVMKLLYCARCKLPVPHMDGSLCPGCAASNKDAWELSAEEREQRFEASFPSNLQARKHRQYEARRDRLASMAKLRAEYAQVVIRKQLTPGPPPPSVDDVMRKLRKEEK